MKWDSDTIRWLEGSMNLLKSKISLGIFDQYWVKWVKCRWVPILKFSELSGISFSNRYEMAPRRCQKTFRENVRLAVKICLRWEKRINNLQNIYGQFPQLSVKRPNFTREIRKLLIRNTIFSGGETVLSGGFLKPFVKRGFFKVF
jgi:hypothetical protein